MVHSWFKDVRNIILFFHLIAFYNSAKNISPSHTLQMFVCQPFIISVNLSFYVFLNDKCSVYSTLSPFVFLIKLAYMFFV